MQSVFYPDERINIRYSIYIFPWCVWVSDMFYVCMTAVAFLLYRFDIKGCEVGRWTNPDTGGKQIIKVLKDNNFEGQSIALGKCPLTYFAYYCSHMNDAIELSKINAAEHTWVKIIQQV